MTDAARASLILDASDRTKAAFASVNNNLKGVQSIVKTATFAFTGLFSVIGARRLFDFAKDAVQAGDALANVSRTAGVSAESLQELRFAFSQLSDLTDGAVDDSLEQFNRRLGDAIQGTGEAAEALKALRVPVTNANGSIRSTESVLNDALAALSGVENEAVRAAHATDLFGRSAGPSMAAALGQGVDAMEALRAAAPGVISNTNVALAAELTDEFDRMARTVGGTLKNAFIEVTARAGDFFGVVDLSEQAELLMQIRDLEREIARHNPGGGQFGSFNRPLSEAQSDLAEARRQLQIERARAAGVGGFATRSFHSAPMDLVTPSLPRFFASIRDANFEAQQFAEAGAEADRQWRITLDNIVSGWNERDRLREESDLAEAEKAQRAIEAAVREKAAFFEIAEEQKRIADEMKAHWEGFGKGLGSGLEDSLANAFLGIETNFKDMLKRMAAQALASGLMNMLANSATGGMASFFNFLGFGGGKAMGGPVMAGTGYVVGERGPELFMPGRSGSIVPNHALGGVTINQKIDIDARGASHGVAEQLRTSLDNNNRALIAHIRDLMRRGRL